LKTLDGQLFEIDKLVVLGESFKQRILNQATLNLDLLNNADDFARSDQTALQSINEVINRILKLNRIMRAVFNLIETDLV